MKKYVLLLLTAVLLLCAAAALADLPTQCPDCGVGFDDGWYTSAYSSGHHCSCESCGYYESATHVHATCESCGFATSCAITYSHIDGTSQHRAFCLIGALEGTCPNGYVTETVVDCEKPSVCYSSHECVCGTVYPPLEHEPDPNYLLYNDEVHYSPCRWYCGVQLNVASHTDAGGYCPTCRYIFNAENNTVYLFGYEAGAEIPGIFVAATYMYFRLESDTSYHIVEGDPKDVFSAPPVRSGKFEPGKQYWLLAQMRSMYSGETPEGGYRLNLPVSDARVLPVESHQHWVAFKLEPLPGTPTPAVPATGDGGAPALWLAVLTLAAAGVLTLRRLRKA